MRAARRRPRFPIDGFLFARIKRCFASARNESEGGWMRGWNFKNFPKTDNISGELRRILLN
jgi:hypothetical protein